MKKEIKIALIAAALVAVAWFVYDSRRPKADPVKSPCKTWGQGKPLGDRYQQVVAYSPHATDSGARVM